MVSHCKRLSRGLISKYLRRFHRFWEEIRKWHGIVRGCQGSDFRTFEESSERDKKGASHRKRLSKELILEYLRTVCRIREETRKWHGIVRDC